MGGVLGFFILDFFFLFSPHIPGALFLLGILMKGGFSKDLTLA